MPESDINFPKVNILDRESDCNFPKVKLQESIEYSEEKKTNKLLDMIAYEL